MTRAGRDPSLVVPSGSPGRTTREEVTAMSVQCCTAPSSTHALRH